ncbi:hypothetical protein [Clostridium algidicarnis]|uniref:hypothetical protein n=2 Tax=Clostridium algidicarnis TaxID=37659 RepID=UPI001C0CC845|nr:hypothetical protein [Clostridium algidicarnis]MBU3221821.1 hypothetical protein [Clostridium algidicarnis]
MINRYLKEKAISLQDDYCYILKEAVSKFSTGDFPMIVDEIKIFWFANRDLVRLILNNISSDFDCYIFTGATFLDIDDLEHYPFVALGKEHVVDDPLYKYASIVSSIDNQDFAEQLKGQMLLSIKDNIKILENYSDNIYILPVTLMSDTTSNLLKKAAEQAFFSMFKDNSITLKKYYNEFLCIEDIIKELRDGVSETLVFSEESSGDDLCSRFRSHIAQVHPFSDKISEAMIFYYIVNGFFLQAFDILLRCSEYRMIPYLRYEVTFRYTILLGANFDNNAEMQMILFKSICTHLLYRVFDKNRIRDIDFNYFINNIKKENFDTILFESLHKAGVNLINPSFQKITDVMKIELSRIYASLDLECN